MVTRSADDASRVIVILDANPHFWGKHDGLSATPPTAISVTALTFEQVFQNVMVFINTIMLLHHHNEVVLIATGCSSWKILYDSSLRGSEAAGAVRLTGVSHSHTNDPIIQRLKDFVAQEEEAWLQQKRVLGHQGSLLSGALSMALCYIQKKAKGPSPHPQSRIFCLQGSQDAPNQYVAVMNAIFSAQRYGVPVDACIVGGHHSAFLQQAAHITGGVYVKPQQPEGLMQYCMMLFATDLHSRDFLHLPSSAGVDFRASCFCHKNVIDMGFVCSVCLSIFCKHQKTCTTCRADFTSSRASSLHSSVGKNGNS